MATMALEIVDGLRKKNNHATDISSATILAVLLAFTIILVLKSGRQGYFQTVKEYTADILTLRPKRSSQDRS